jgi:hypothetical protein
MVCRRWGFGSPVAVGKMNHSRIPHIIHHSSTAHQPPQHQPPTTYPQPLLYCISELSVAEDCSSTSAPDRERGRVPLAAARCNVAHLVLHRTRQAPSSALLNRTDSGGRCETARLDEISKRISSLGVAGSQNNHRIRRSAARKMSRHRQAEVGDAVA